MSLICNNDDNNNVTYILLCQHHHRRFDCDSLVRGDVSILPKVMPSMVGVRHFSNFEAVQCMRDAQG